MNSRERVARAMRHEEPDRVPVMCQLSLGHYFLNSGLGHIDIWHDSVHFANALLHLQRRYAFDGILVNLPGRDPKWRDQVRSFETHGAETWIRWRNGRISVCPHDDLPHVEVARPSIHDIDPDTLYYVEPYDLTGLTLLEEITPWQLDAIDYVRREAPDISLHSEVFSPFTQLLELLGYTEALLALMDEPDRVTACLRSLCRGTVDLMLAHAVADVDAILISSAFAGAGFISREHYRQFVLPFERAVIDEFKRYEPDVPVYTHTCGAIGDRLDLMVETGTNGIEALDPPPLGTVELAAARDQLRGRAFIKGNIDPVNTLLIGSPQQVFTAATERLRIMQDTPGFILSSACSVSPYTPPANLLELVRAANTQLAVL